VRNAGGVLISSSGGIRGTSFLANGDLEGLPPAAAQCAFDGAGAEGTAILEIVHDLAPAAQLSFANPDTDLAFNQAVDFLAATNDVVLDDLGFFAESYDGTSAVSSNTARALNNPAFPIRGYFTSVGNSADEHYYGAYVDSHVDGRTVPGIVRPATCTCFNRPPTPPTCSAWDRSRTTRSRCRAEARWWCFSAGTIRPADPATTTTCIW